MNTFENIWLKAKNHLAEQWLVCRVMSGRKSAQYGVRFTYPVYITMVALATYFQSPYVLIFAAVLAFVATLLPMHPLDYLYNITIANLLPSTKIPARGSEMQMNSWMSLAFSLVVLALIVVFAAPISYAVLAVMYVLISVFFIVVQLSSDNFSIGSIREFFFGNK